MFELNEKYKKKEDDTKNQKNDDSDNHNDTGSDDDGDLYLIQKFYSFKL